ncbi:hypothetical protein [Nitrospira sp. BLG_1]|uniref:hypothetical protein n=1 Tax=Nitrospira sp. BLG_1 TaxID=3395883 RepID=UPI0039BD78FF
MTGESYPRPEDRVIEAFVGYLANTLYPDLKITDWPDKRNSTTSDIDAVAKSQVGCIAIEHTSVDTFPDQRLHDSRFMKAIGCLEDELTGMVDCRLRVIIPFGTVPTGISWEGVRDEFRMWILDEVPQLPFDKWTIVSIDGIPFSLTVHKSISDLPGLFLIRSGVENEDFSERLKLQVDVKAQKLAKYRNSCNLLVVLIENDDLANMSRGKMIKAVEESYHQSLPHGIDRIWYADSSSSGPVLFWNVTPVSRRNMPLMTGMEELKRPPE